MAFTRAISLVCAVVAALCGLALSQAPTGADQSLFSLMSSQPSAGTGGMGAMSGLDGLLNTMGGAGSFAGSPVGSPAPNPTYPTMGGAAPAQAANPLARLFPLLMFSGLDMSKMMMMMLFGGMGGMGGGMGGMGMLPMMGLLNNM